MSCRSSKSWHRLGGKAEGEKKRGKGLQKKKKIAKGGSYARYFLTVYVGGQQTEKTPQKNKKKKNQGVRLNGACVRDVMVFLEAWGGNNQATKKGDTKDSRWKWGSESKGQEVRFPLNRRWVSGP